MNEQTVAVLKAVRYLEREFGATTVRDVQAHCQFTSSSIASYWLAKARARGFVTWRNGAARTIKLTEKGRASLEEWRAA